jgi:hypothetical protein
MPTAEADMYNHDLFGNPVITQTRCRVTVQGGTLHVMTPYNPQFVALIKSLPPSARRFDPDNKTWLVDAQYSGSVRSWILAVYGEDIGDIAPSVQQPQTEMRILDVWYLGRTKPAGDEYVANGMNAKNEWIFIFPEHVLREWFEGLSAPSGAPTLYGVLGIQRGASADEIKSAYRRMARQWHPDICREPGAYEMFIRLQEAYEILNDPKKRAKYDAGLALEASLGKQADTEISCGYRSPLRCGYILAEGHERLGRFYVTKILEWRDIETEHGTLTASWPAGADKPVWNWV